MTTTEEHENRNITNQKYMKEQFVMETLEVGPYLWSIVTLSV